MPKRRIEVAVDSVVLMRYVGDTTGVVRGLVLHQNGQMIPGKKIR